MVSKSGKREPLLQALPRLVGQVVLEGESGLGKSMFIRYLLRTSKRLAVYLPAERCKEGVLEAIQAKLEDQAKDPGFLQSIIYSGALDIYIDGLNEVTADTRARIVQFTERNFHGNILLATQRIEWTPPPMARLLVLQPLSEVHIQAFLVSREPLLDAGAKLRGHEYIAACERFVGTSLATGLAEDLRRAVRETLSNPMDLTVVAQMLSEGHEPDPFRLREQQYERMAADYRKTHLADFPLKAFSEAAFQMRLKDEALIPEEPFSRELLRLDAAKMVIQRQYRSRDGKDHREWSFRHDKIQEFFIAQTFLGQGNPRVGEHLGDPRFRGVYFLLSQLLDPEEARALRDLLVEHAAATGDHTISDPFVNLLKKRPGSEPAKGAETGPAQRSTGG